MDGLAITIRENTCGGGRYTWEVTDPAGIGKILIRDGYADTPEEATSAAMKAINSLEPTELI